jgi:hypothetical protein
MFAVVEWKNTSPKQISIVPISWLFGEGDDQMSYWPSHLTSDSAIANSVKKLIEPTDKWTSHPVKCLSVKGRTVQLRSFRIIH